MNKPQFGNLLKSFLAKENDIVKISRWTFRIYNENLRDLDPSMVDILECLFIMEDDPQFEYTESELHFIADTLIREGKDPFKRLEEIKARRWR